MEEVDKSENGSFAIFAAAPPSLNLYEEQLT
jgi:hypothetical protein